MEEAENSQSQLPGDSKELQLRIEQQSKVRCAELIQDIEKFLKENKFWAKVWISVYVLVGLTAVISSSISAILTFFPANKGLLFATALASTASAYILTFLNPSGREEKRRQAVRRSFALLEKVKTTKQFIGLAVTTDTLEKISNLSDQFASLIEDSLK
jgi:translation elongation factor EF-1alpha